MTTDMIIILGRKTLEITFLIAAPILIVTTIASLLINVCQVLTSIQEQTISIVPKLAITAGAVFVLLPWMSHKLTAFTLALLADLGPYTR